MLLYLFIYLFTYLFIFSTISVFLHICYARPYKEQKDDSLDSCELSKKEMKLNKKNVI